MATADCGSEHAKASAKATKAIYPTAKAAGFETLSTAIAAAGLEEVLTDEGPFTVFAPTDEAFAKLPEGSFCQSCRQINAGGSLATAPFLISNDND